MNSRNADPQWTKPPSRPILKARDLHVWRADLDELQMIIEQLKQLLSADELEKAHRFRFETDSRRFVVARAVLRKLLAVYLEIDPKVVAFSYSEYGKPSLVGTINHLSLSFNVAHSGPFALYALAVEKRVGVDLECIRPEFTGDEIARRYFSPGEVAALNRLPYHVRHEAFFACWTRKEAFIKAMGMGLSLPLDQFEVSVNPNEPPALLYTQWDESEASRWSLMMLAAGFGYAATVAAEGLGWNLSTWRLDPQWLQTETSPTES